MVVHRPRDSWYIDWDDAGDYSHTAADVSDNVLAYDVRYGVDWLADESRLPYVGADGQLDLVDDEGVYDPDQGTGPITTAQLRTPHLVKFMSDNSAAALWEGYAIPRGLRDRDPHSPALWELRSKQYRDLDNDIRVIDSTVKLFYTHVLANSSGISIDTAKTIATQQIGLVTFEGTYGDYLRAAGEYCCGWLSEKKTGEFVLLSHSWAAAQSPRTDEVSYVTYSLDRERTYVRRQAGLVRNKVNMVQRSPTSQAITDLWSGTVTVPASGTLTFTIYYAAADVVYVDGWSATASGYTTTISALGLLTATCTITGPAGSATVNASGTIYKVTSGTFETKSDNTSMGLYGTQVWDPPDWWTEASFGWGRQWIDFVKQPPPVVVASISRWASTMSISQGIDLINVSHVVNVDVPDAAGGTSTYKTLVLGVRFAGQSGRIPVLEFAGVAIGSGTTPTPGPGDTWDTGVWDTTTWS